MRFPLLAVQKLSAFRDDRCLYAHVSICLNAGEVLQITGPNGAGKTTLIKQLAGLSGVHRDQLFWRGCDLSHDIVPYLQDTLYLGHQAGVKAGLTVAENLRHSAAIRGLRVSSLQLDLALERVRLAGYEDVLCQHLSAGQQRRVALARLFTEPATLWLLDEPFTAIDQVGVGEIEQWIDAHHASGGACILSTHHHLSLSCPVQRLALASMSVNAEVST